MTPEARRFYVKYHLLTRLLPCYCMAGISYGMAILLAGALAAGRTGVGWFGGFILWAGMSYLIAELAAQAVLKPRLLDAPSPELAARIKALLPSGMDAPRLNFVELGAVLFLAISPGANVLWISTHSATELTDAELRAVLLHEAGHSVTQRGCAWYDLLWLLAFPVALLLHDTPLLVVAAALVHAQAVLHLTQWLRERGEAQADRWAAQRMGRLEYAAAIAAYLAHFEHRGAGLRTARLKRMGLSNAEIEQVLTRSTLV